MQISFQMQKHANEFQRKENFRSVSNRISFYDNKEGKSKAKRQNVILGKNIRRPLQYTVVTLDVLLERLLQQQSVEIN